ncbi:M23 family metallopeptidase [Pseudoxanthomonas suwonensis]|uniref:Endopeptidase n=1 Tax=Pseudoxanthomonas suwonensis TaxID=314722 RepID=A0A0E3Z299_9GAMM|nr:M23 family metallopeptidase [Pseudoxanthomonas suwonensis]AKC86074.1 endopeptidase [Pseudoxanthomonas suwonensis]
MKLLLALMLCVLAALGVLVFFGADGESLALVRVVPSGVDADPPPVDGREPVEAAQHATPPPAAVRAAPAIVPPAPAMPAPGTQAHAPPLLLPVQGVAIEQLQDTFTDARSQGRLHDAIDIMAPAGTPVLAVADGTVEKLFDSERGGLTVYQFEPSGRLAYYYAHLQRYAEGLHEGQALRRGQVIGYVGATGNASADAPHLHFAIFVLGPERRWWEGTAVNPYPVLRGDAPLP